MVNLNLISKDKFQKMGFKKKHQDSPLSVKTMSLSNDTARLFRVYVTPSVVSYLFSINTTVSFNSTSSNLSRRETVKHRVTRQ